LEGRPLDLKATLFVIAWIVIGILLLFHVKQRVKKYTLIVGDNYKNMIDKIGNPCLPKGTQENNNQIPSLPKDGKTGQ
jgi:hypothetical protein